MQRWRSWVGLSTTVTGRGVRTQDSWPACRLLRAHCRAAEASFAGANAAPPTFLPARVVAYNGKPYQSKAPTLIFVAFVNGQAAAELDFRVQQQPTGPYGLAFHDIDFPSA